jgi:membrane protease YdiL (CAAX protease family)
MAPLNKYSPFLQLVIFIGIYLVCTLIYSLVFMGWILPHTFGVTAFDLQNGNLDDPYLMQIMKLVQLFYSIFSFLVPALIFVYLAYSKPMKETGLGPKFYPGWALFGIIILICSLPAVGVLSDLNRQIHFGPLDQTFRSLQQKAKEVTQAMLIMPNSGSLLFNIFIIAVIPAIAEEFFFRGVLQRLLVVITNSAWIGVGLAAIVFSLLHAEMLGFFPRVALGIVLGGIYYFSGNLWYSITAHFFNNGFQVVLVYLYQQHVITQDITQNTPTPFSLGIISVIVVAGMFFIFQKFVPRSSKNTQYRY